MRRDDGAKGFVPIGYIEQVDAEEIAHGSSDMSVTPLRKTANRTLRQRGTRMKMRKT